MPDAPAAAKRSWHRLYYALGAFNVVSVLVAIALGYAAMAGFSTSVDVNARWADRVGAYAVAACAELARARRQGRIVTTRTRCKADRDALGRGPDRLHTASGQEARSAETGTRKGPAGGWDTPRTPPGACRCTGDRLCFRRENQKGSADDEDGRR